VAQAQAVVEDHRLQVVQAALQALAPHRGALQLVRGADVEHQHAVDGADQGLVIQVGGEQLGVARTHAAVAADVQVPALLGGDHAGVLALRLGTLAGAAGDAELDLVRRAQALVAVLQGQGHADAVVHAVAAPGAAHAGLHGAQALAVGVAGLEAGLDQLGPDIRLVVQLAADHADALAAGDLGVEAVLLGHLPDGEEAFGGDLAAGHARHHRVGAVLLHVGHEGVVSVLQRHQRRVLDRAIPAGGEDRTHRRLADVAAQFALAVAGQQVLEALDALDADDVVQLLAGVGEVF